MGCRDRKSNFNTYHYKDGKWRVGWGWGDDLTFEAPSKEILEEELQSRSGVWVVQTTDRATLIAKEAKIPGVDKGISYASECLPGP